MIAVREQAQVFVRKFLDPYDGGIENKGWPFGGTLYAQDFGRIVSEISAIRHVTDVKLFGVEEGRDQQFPGWEKGQGSDLLTLDNEDLFIVRHVRILSEDGES